MDRVIYSCPDQAIIYLSMASSVSCSVFSLSWQLFSPFMSFSFFLWLGSGSDAELTSCVQNADFHGPFLWHNLCHPDQDLVMQLINSIILEQGPYSFS